MRTTIAERTRLLAAGLTAALLGAPALAAEPAGVRAPPRPIPEHLGGLTQVPPPPSAAGVAKSNVFFLNYDGVTIKFTGQEDDATQDITQFQEFAINYGSYGAGAKRAASFQALQSDWSKYAVTVTDQRPGNGNYTMCVNSPTVPAIYQGQGVLGVAPLDCNDSQARNIVFAYHSDNDEFSAATQATTMSQEIAHSYGLEHVNQPNDIMNPYNAGGDPSFLDQCLSLSPGAMCNGQHNQFCGGGAQNSHQELVWLFGLSEPDGTPPTVMITNPQNGAMFEAGAMFEIQATASDNVGVAEVELFINGASEQTDASEPFSWTVQGIPAGDYCFKATARDLSDNAADSAEVCITVTNASNPTTDPTTDPSTDPTNDSNDSNVTTLPDTDTGGDSLSGGDTSDATGDTPTTDGVDPTTVPVATLPGLPPDYGQDDDSGCRVAPPAPTASLVLLALLGLRRRRR